jgi:hypothetical protein
MRLSTNLGLTNSVAKRKKKETKTQMTVGKSSNKFIPGINNDFKANATSTYVE